LTDSGLFLVVRIREWIVEAHLRQSQSDSPSGPFWLHAYDNCPTCGYNLDAHVRDEALEKARREDGPDARRCRVVFYWWPRLLRTCPQCGVSLP